MPWPELDEVLEQVARFHALGICTVPTCQPTADGGCTARWHERPCSRRGKRPLFRDYPDRAFALIPLEQALQEFRDHWPCNPAIVVPVGSRVVEGDSLEAEEEILALGGDAVRLAPARERRPGRGRAFLFREDPDRRSATSTRRGTSGHIDTLAPGTIFMVALAVHLTGHVNTWVQGRAPWEVTIPYLPAALRALEAAHHHGASLGEGARRAPQRSNGTESGSVSPRVTQLLHAHRSLRGLWMGEKDGGDTSASGIDYSVACELLKLRVPHAEVVQALLSRPGAHRVTLAYAETTTSKAMAAVARRSRR